jgi:hypothetical protein
MTRSAVGVLILVASGIVAACGSGGGARSGSTAPPTEAAGTSTTVAASTDSAPDGPATTSVSPTAIAGLTAILEQYREDEILNLLQVKASNRSTSSVDVLDLRLDWAGITGNDPVARGVLVSPGQRVDIPINAGRAVCSDPPGADEQPPPTPAAAVGHASIDGGPPVLISIPITDSGKILPKIFPLSCRDQRVQWAAKVSFGTTWTRTTTSDGAPAVRGTVEMQRNHSTEPITLVRLNGSVLLRLVDLSPSSPAAVLDAGQDSLTVPILIEQSGRCESHALAESKKTYLIVLDVGIGDEPPIGDEVAFDIPSRVVLGKMINDSCGVG